MPENREVSAGLVMENCGFGNGKFPISAGLVMGIWLLLTYSNRNITTPGVRLTLPPGRKKNMILSCCPVFLILKNNRRGHG
jgi:hypothetical protein